MRLLFAIFEIANRVRQNGCSLAWMWCLLLWKAQSLRKNRLYLLGKSGNWWYGLMLNMRGSIRLGLEARKRSVWASHGHVDLALGPFPDPKAGDVAAIIGGGPGHDPAVPGRMWMTLMERYFTGASGSFRSRTEWNMFSRKTRSGGLIEPHLVTVTTAEGVTGSGYVRERAATDIRSGGSWSDSQLGQDPLEVGGELSYSVRRVQTLHEE